MILCEAHDDSGPLAASLDLGDGPITHGMADLLGIDPTVLVFLVTLAIALAALLLIDRKLDGIRRRYVAERNPEELDDDTARDEPKPGEF